MNKNDELEYSPEYLESRISLEANEIESSYFLNKDSGC